MVTRTSNYRIEDLLGSPRHGGPFCCDKTPPGGGAAFASSTHLDLQKTHATAPPGLVNPVPVRLHRGPSASGQSGSRAAGPQTDLPLHQIAQLLALAQQSKDQRLTLDDVAENAHMHSVAQFAQPTAFQPVAPTCCNVLPQSSNVDSLLHYGHAAHALSPVVPPHSAAQFTPIPWFIYQQMALRQAYQSGGSPGVLASIHNPATYFFAAQAHYRKPKRIRTAFSPSQLLRLEAAFDKNPYVVGQERKELASSLNLRETQVKVWFQNRRTKKKRMKLEDFESPFEDGETMEDGTRPPSSLSISSKDSTSCNSPTNSPVKA